MRNEVEGEGTIPVRGGESVQTVRGKREQCVDLGPGSSSKWLEERVKGGSGTDEAPVTKHCENVKYHYSEAMGDFKIWSMGMT